MRTVTVWGNYGELDVNRETGEVLLYRPELTLPPEYQNITRVDLEEFRQWLATSPRATTTWERIESIDINDVGFWDEAGEYEEALFVFRDRLPERFGAPAEFPF